MCGTNGLDVMRAIDRRTSSSRSVNASDAQAGVRCRVIRPRTDFLKALVGEGEHPAVRVVDEDDLAGAEQPLADRQRPDLVVGHDAAGVADDVRLAVVQAEEAVDVEPGVHAGDDGDVLRRAAGAAGPWKDSA